MQTFRDLPYIIDGHERQKLDLYLPDGGEKHPLIIWIHGGAFRMGSIVGAWGRARPRCFRVESAFARPRARFSNCRKTYLTQH